MIRKKKNDKDTCVKINICDRCNYSAFRVMNNTICPECGNTLKNYYVDGIFIPFQHNPHFIIMVGIS